MPAPVPQTQASAKQSGFSLIEVMIVVVIVAVLAMVALPSYNDSVRKSRRSEAFAAISAIQQAQERWRGNRPAYTTNLTAAMDDADAPGLGLSDQTPNGYYALDITAANAAGYTIVAEGKASQAEDTQCRKLSVRMQGGNLTYAGCGTCDAFTYSEANACWVR